MADLPLTIPVEDIVLSALRELRDDGKHGLDRDEAYLLARLERGERLQILPPITAAV